jgi:hypothetical protein
MNCLSQCAQREARVRSARGRAHTARKGDRASGVMIGDECATNTCTHAQLVRACVTYLRERAPLSTSVLTRAMTPRATQLLASLRSIVRDRPVTIRVDESSVGGEWCTARSHVDARTRRRRAERRVGAAVRVLVRTARRCRACGDARVIRAYV